MPNIRFEDIPTDNALSGNEVLFAFENGFNSDNAKQFPLNAIKKFITPLSNYSISPSKFTYTPNSFYQAYTHKTNSQKYLISKFVPNSGTRTFYQGSDGNLNAAWNNRAALAYSKTKNSIIT